MTSNPFAKPAPRDPFTEDEMVRILTEEVEVLRARFAESCGSSLDRIENLGLGDDITTEVDRIRSVVTCVRTAELKDAVNMLPVVMRLVDDVVAVAIRRVDEA
ncbi:hypothetical protein ACWDTG_25635 [Rhodococcus zopfii]